MRPCPECGKSIKDLATVCKYCEQAVPAANPSNDPKIAAAVAQQNDPRNQWYCVTCGSIGRPRRYTKGSFGIEVLLWLLLILPGVLYSVWRLTTKYQGCPKCGAANMIPASSPKAQQAIAALTQRP